MTAMFPLPVWIQGTTQPATPVNDSFLRTEVLARGATSILSTPPGSPADGQVHILGASPTGAWSTFAQHDVVLWRSGTWYRFAPFLGWLKQVGTEVRRFDGTAWSLVASGGVGVQDEGTSVTTAATSLNFVGGGVSAAEAGGVVTITIPGGSGGGSSGFISGDSPFTFSAVDETNLVSVGVRNLTGTFSGIAVTAGTLLERTPRGRIVSGGSTPTSISGIASRRNQANTGSLCRWRFRHVFSVDSNPMAASHRLIVGVSARISFTDVDPSTILNFAGFGYDSADTQWQFMSNDGAGVATKNALGAAWPKPSTRAPAVYAAEMTFDGSSIAWSLIDLTNLVRVSGTRSTDLPASTVFLGLDAHISAGGVVATQSGLLHFSDRLVVDFPSVP